MSQDVTYADVKFVRTPRKKEKNQLEDASDREITYENVQQARPGKEVTPSCSEHPKNLSHLVSYTSAALIVSCLFLLAIAIGFGVSYGHISQKLQEASQILSANSSLLEQRIHTEKSNLAQAQEKLRKAERALNSTLWERWSSGNKTERRLQELEEELRQAKAQLTQVRREKEAAEATLSKVQEEWDHARSCQQIGCCPSGSVQWKLFRWKCLWVSQWTKSWKDGKADCIQKSSQLLILKDPWTVEDLWEAEGTVSLRDSYQYWIGLRRKNWYSSWLWTDGSDFKGDVQPGYGGDCVQMSQNGLKQYDCETRLLYICEMAATT